MAFFAHGKKFGKNISIMVVVGRYLLVCMFTIYSGFESCWSLQLFMLKKLLVKDDNKQKRGQGRRQKKVFFYITRSEALKIVSIDLPITAHCYWSFILQPAAVIYLQLPHLFEKMGQSRPLFDYFRFFLITISIIQIENKHRWRAWDLNLGPQDGRRRQNHGAMAAHLILTFDILSGKSIKWSEPWNTVD